MKRYSMMLCHALQLACCVRQSSPGDAGVLVEALPDRSGVLLCICLAVGHRPDLLWLRVCLREEHVGRTCWAQLQLAHGVQHSSVPHAEVSRAAESSLHPAIQQPQPAAPATSGTARLLLSRCRHCSTVQRANEFPYRCSVLRCSCRSWTRAHQALTGWVSVGPTSSWQVLG